jgi:phosphoribosylamine-glycine ligase
VIDACGTGASLREALRCAYTAAARIQWPGKTLRKDIGRTLVESSSGVFPLPPGLRGGGAG